MGERVSVEVGDVLYGYCGGAFGRDSYADKMVLAVGHDWVTVREMGQSRTVLTAQGPNIRLELSEYLTMPEEEE